MTCNGGRMCVLQIGGAVGAVVARQKQHLDAFPGCDASNLALRVMA